jgi:spore coat protein H
MLTVVNRRWIHGLLSVAALVLVARPSAAQPPDAANALFNDQMLHEIRLYVNSKDLVLLHEHWQDDTHVPADFKWNGQVVRNVSLKSHGGGSRRPDKMNLKVGFDHYTDGQTFLGLHSVLLRNNSQDASNMRERLSMLLFRSLGMAAEREAHTRLYVNDVYAGLYTICEEYDTDFLHKNLGESTGHLYEFKFDNVAALAGQPVFTFQYLGSNPSAYVPSPFEPQTLPDDPQGDVIARFVQAISDTGAAAWRDNVSAFLDIPKFIRHLSIENFLAEEDGLTGDFGLNNFYLYRFTNTTMFRFLPWDKSNAFWDPTFSIFRNISDGPLPQESRNLLVLRALQEPDLLQLYLDTLLECAAFAAQTDAPDQPTWLEAEVEREYGQVHQAALDDTILYSNAEFEQAIVDLLTFAHNRATIVQAQVAAARGE